VHQQIERMQMRALRYLLTKLARFFWWPAVVGAVFVIGCGVLGVRSFYFAAPTASGTDPWLDRWNRSFTFAASSRNAVILTRFNTTDTMKLLLVDFETGKRVRLKSERSRLSSPYLSPDGTRLLFSRVQLGHQPGYELVSCNTAAFACRTILRSSGSIHSAIEISEGRILYVSSPYYKGYNGQFRLNRNDIWIFDPATGPRQLTDFRLYELDSLSVADGEIYFSAEGPARDRLIIPKYQPMDDRQSSIYRLPFDSAKGTIDIPSGTIAPLFAESGIAMRPSVSSDGALIAFLRTRTGISPYRYDLVIADQTRHSERTVLATGLGFSRPVVIGHDVYAGVTRDDRVSILVDRPGEPSMKLLADIDDASIGVAETIELKIEP
jgi:hypothetical protein